MFRYYMYAIVLVSSSLLQASESLDDHAKKLLNEFHLGWEAHKARSIIKKKYLKYLANGSTEIQEIPQDIKDEVWRDIFDSLQNRATWPVARPLFEIGKPVKEMFFSHSSAPDKKG